MLHMPRLQIRNLPMRTGLTSSVGVLCQLRYDSDTSGVLSQRLRSTVVRFQSADSNTFQHLTGRDSLTMGWLPDLFRSRLGKKKIEKLGYSLSQQRKKKAMVWTFFQTSTLLPSMVTPGRRFVGMIHPPTH